MSKWKMKTVLAASAAALLVGVSAPAANAAGATADTVTPGGAQFAENQTANATFRTASGTFQVSS